MAVIPIPSVLILCDTYVGYDNGKIDLYNLFNAIRPETEFPHRRTKFCVFTQLTNGLGRVPFFLQIRDADSDEVIYTTDTQELVFENRFVTVQVAYFIRDCIFPTPGSYFVEMVCDDTWVGDYRLRLLEPEDE